MTSSEERFLQEFCSQYNVDETACKSYVERLEFLDAKVKKRVTEQTSRKMYLKQHGLKISGSKADLTCVKTNQLQSQSQVIPMERTHTLKSHLKYFLYLRKTSNT